MACCDKHDRLDLTLHAVEFTTRICGSPRLETLSEILPGIAAQSPTRLQNAQAASTGAWAVLDPSDPRGLAVMGYGKPYYCCFDCPTLRGTMTAPVVVPLALAPPDLQAPLAPLAPLP